MKNKALLKYVCLGVAFLFSALVFATMAGAAVTGNVFGLTVSASVYDCLSNGVGTVITAFIFTIICVLGAIGVCVVDYFKVKFNYTHFCAAFFAALALASTVLFFCVSAEVGGSLGVGSVLSAIFSLFAMAGFGGYTFLSFKK